MKAKQKVCMFAALATAMWIGFFALSHPHATINDEHPTVAENFYYYISEDDVLALPGTPIEDLIKRVGDPTEMMDGRYVFDYLTIVSREGRHRGIGFWVAGDGNITEILPLSTTTLGHNWFCNLPLYSTMASHNFFNCASSYSSETFIRWWGPLLMFILFGAAMFFTMHTFSSIVLIKNSEDVKTRNWVTPATIVITVAFCYMMLLPFLNVTHSIWLISIIIYTLTMSASVGGWIYASHSLKVCPKCNKIDAYNPKKVIFDTTQLPEYTIHRPSGYLRTRSSILTCVAEKTITLREWHRMEGKCTHCGYEDTDEYWTDKPQTVTTQCPLCGAMLDINRYNIKQGYGNSRSRDYGPATMDMNSAEQIGDSKFRGDITQHRQTITSHWISFDYHEKCPCCSYEFGPQNFTNFYETSSSREVTERGVGRTDRI